MFKKAIVFLLMVLLITSCDVNRASQENVEPPAILLGTPLVEESPPARNEGECSRIALVITDGVNPEIYTVCPDGSNLINLTGDPAADTNPAWSPDGRRIAFTSDRNGSSQIYIMDADGKFPIQLTSDYVNDKPIWLWDGTRIAFRTTDGNGLWWWRIIDLDTYKIADYSDPSYDFFFQTPAWSPDGARLAYMSLAEQMARNDGSSQIHVKVLPNRSDMALTNDIWANINPLWSPDGEKIAFFSERDGTYNMFALYVINADGSGLQRVTDPVYSERASASWSPDAEWLVVGGNEYPNTDVVIINLKSKEVLHFLDLAAGLQPLDPVWQPGS